MAPLASEQERQSWHQLRSSSVIQGYLSRYIALENSFEKKILELSGRKKFQVLNLGAGSDSGFFRLANQGVLNPDSCSYYEVDLPNVIAEKRKRIRESDLLRRFAEKNGKNYHLISQDLTEISGLESQLTALGFEFEAETVVLSEVVLTYIDHEKVDKILGFVSKLKQCHFFLYEQVNPLDRFGKIMTRHFEVKAKSPLLNVGRYPLKRDQERRLSGYFDKVRSSYLIDILKEYFGSTENERRLRLEPHFDEIEEVFLKCSHYTVVEAVNGSGNFVFAAESDYVGDVDPVFYPSRAKTVPQEFRRFGHKCVMQRDGNVLQFGGTHVHNGRDSVNLPFKESAFSSFCRGDDQSVLFAFGGRSNPLNCSNRLYKITLDDRRCESLAFDGIGPEKRWKSALEYCSGNLVLIGGKSSQCEIFGDIWIFHFKAKKWEKSTKSVETGLYSHSSATVDNNANVIIISGGMTKNPTKINPHIFIYDVEEDSLKQLELDVTPRFSHTSHYFKDKLYLVGGIGDYVQPGICIIHNLFRGNITVKEYELDLPISVGLYNHSSLIDGHILKCYGGGGNCFSFGMHVSTQSLEIDLDHEI